MEEESENLFENPMTLPGREQIQAYISDPGFICIRQENPLMEDPSIVVMYPSDVPVVIGWLQKLLVDHKAMAEENPNWTFPKVP